MFSLLCPRTFVRIFTDHHGLRFFGTQPKLNQRQVRWMEILQDYNHKIGYKSGAKNHVADALSGRVDYIPESECVVNAVTTAAVETDSLQGVIEAHQQSICGSEAPGGVSVAGRRGL